MWNNCEDSIYSFQYVSQHVVYKASMWSTKPGIAQTIIEFISAFVYKKALLISSLFD